MRIPDSLVSLADEGIIEEVLRPLMSGKEAQIYLLRAGGEARVAKVYKSANERTFKQRSEYTEGRRVRNSRDQRAMEKRSRHGRDQDEAAWRGAEVDMIYRLHAAGVRVPRPYQFIDGVLIMELITDADGNPAPRLGDVELDRQRASEIYDELLREVVRMLCAGVVHGDLSDFNVLLGPEGPVIIDFPQAVHASTNLNARTLLLRDIDNLHRFLRRFDPERRALPYGEEMWQLYQRGELTPDVRLTGRYRASEAKVDTRAVLDLIADARDEHIRRKPRAPAGRGQRSGPEVIRARPRGEPVVQQRRTAPLEPSRNVPPPSAASGRPTSAPAAVARPASMPGPRRHASAGSPRPPSAASHANAGSPPLPSSARHANAGSPSRQSAVRHGAGSPPLPSSARHANAGSPPPPSAARHANAGSTPPPPVARPRLTPPPLAAKPPPLKQEAEPPPSHKRKRRRRRRNKSGDPAVAAAPPNQAASRSQRRDVH
jgi:RIO kinase 1